MMLQTSNPPGSKLPQTAPLRNRRPNIGGNFEMLRDDIRMNGVSLVPGLRTSVKNLTKCEKR
jgi:hypothetical protein